MSENSHSVLLRQENVQPCSFFSSFKKNGTELSVAAAAAAAAAAGDHFALQLP